MKIQQFLKLQKKTMKQFCQENGLNYGTMRLYASRHARPSPEMALRIEKATNGKVKRLELLYPENGLHRHDGNP